MTTDFKQANAAVRYQLVAISKDGKDDYAVAPIRDTWEEAADDAVNMDWADWESQHVLKLKDGVTIKRIREQK